MLRRAASLSLLVALACACAPPGFPDGGDGSLDGGPVTDGGLPDTGFPAPRTDAASPVGSDGTLDVVTWNIENFPAHSSTPSLVADIITSMDVDLIAIQELADTNAFQELIQRLPRHHGIYSSHTYSDGNYQKVGFIYRDDLLTPTDVRLLFPGSGWEFPRPPMQVTFTLDDGERPPLDFIAISLHLKAGRSAEDAERREAAMVLLEQHLRSLVDGPADDEILLLGDFNEVLNESNGRAVFAPFLNEAQRYRVQTEALALAGAATYLPSERMYDHILTTTALDDEIASRVAVVPRLDNQVSGYEALVSDHLPVVISLPVLE